jgi:mono/diheme cytochrome c family protein
MKWILAGAVVLALLLWFLTQPVALSPEDLPGHLGEVDNGQRIFNAGGCSSCHGADLGGGLEMPSEFGTFLVPNISTDPVYGIGGWTTVQFVNAMMLGVSPTGQHYYPAFPYTSYTRMKVQDVIDLKAFLDLQEPVERQVGQHQVGFPWNLRRGIGLWKILYLKQGAVVDSSSKDALIQQGRYLVEGPGHCGECHTPRDSFGGLQTGWWLAGAPNPDGEGRVPNITPHPDGLKSWSQSDIAYYLESGFLPDYDTVGGSMVEVQENMAKLTEQDREAIAAYLKAIPARSRKGE